MKLVEIKDVRVGQIWEAHNNLFVVETAESYINKKYQFARVAMYERGQKVCFGKKQAPDYFEDKKLIGKIGITHSIEGYSLHEIPRQYGELPRIDDVVKFKSDPRLYVINREIDFGIKKVHPNNTCFEATNDLYGSRQLVDFEIKKIGILGVTHEFINERLVK